MCNQITYKVQVNNSSGAPIHNLRIKPCRTPYFYGVHCFCQKLNFCFQQNEKKVWFSFSLNYFYSKNIVSNLRTTNHNSGLMLL